MENLKQNRQVFIKWEDEFKCSFCKNDKFILGNEVFTRICDQCGKKEVKSMKNAIGKAKKNIYRFFSFFF